MSDNNSSALGTRSSQRVAKKKARASNKLKNQSALDSMTGFDYGLEPHRIVGANKVDDKLVFYIIWNDPKTGEHMPNCEMVAATEVYQKAPQLAISFFEENFVIPYIDDEREIKMTLDSKTGFNRGLEPHHIFGANLRNNKLVFFIVWKHPKTGEPITNFDMIDEVVATEVYQKTPQIAIKFFEEHIKFDL